MLQSNICTGRNSEKDCLRCSHEEIFVTSIKNVLSNSASFHEIVFSREFLGIQTTLRESFKYVFDKKKSSLDNFCT